MARAVTFTQKYIELGVEQEALKQPGASIAVKYRCEHEYAKAWRCSKCGYEIPRNLLSKIAETSWGKIERTTVY